LLAAALGAVGAIVAAVIATSDGSRDGADGATGSATETSSPYGVTIRDVIYRERDDAALFNVHGVASGVPAWDEIYVLARPEDEPPDGAPSSAGDWLVSNRAERSEDGSWETDLTVPRGTPTPLRFVAVIYTGDLCPPPEECNSNDPRGLLAEEGPAPFAPSLPFAGP
jgi:hypothetical protein